MTPQHATHDRVLVATLAAREGDLDPVERAGAETLVAGCADCRDLLADLVAQATAIPSAVIPPRPRDFLITPADAARLRPRGWRRLLGFVGSARDGFTRPLAVGLTTMGIVALLVAALPSGLGGASSAVLSTVGNAVGGQVAAPAADPSSAPYRTEGLEIEPDAAATAAGDGGLFSGAGDAATGSDRQGDDALEAAAAIRDDRSGRSALAVVAGALLILGFGLFALRWTARRLGDR